MRRIKILFLFSCALLSWAPPVFSWSIPDIRVEGFGGRGKWREERGEERRRAIQDQREERGRRDETEPRRQDEAERHSLSPEERRELRRQIRRANQDDHR